MSTRTTNAFLIFSGYNTRAIVAFCREATRLSIPFAIVARSQDDAMFLTSYREQVVAVRTERLLVADDIERCIAQAREQLGAEHFVILPSSEFLVRYFLDHRAHYAELGCALPLVPADIYELVSDKYSFRCVCQQHRLPIPAEYPSLEGLSLPFVAKPKLYFSGNRTRTLVPYLVLTSKDLDQFLQNEDPSEFYYQEYITGASYYLLYFISRQGRDVQYSQRNLVQQADGKSMILSESADLHHHPVAGQYLDMLKNIGFYGLVMVELKPKGDEYVMIEANPRLWGPSQLFVDAKVPIFEAFIREQGFDLPDFSLDNIHPVDYFWNGGIVEDRSKGKHLAFHDYPSERFEQRIATLMDQEIYRRDDTQGIFYQESKGIC